MADRNQVEQVVKLNAKQYLDAQQKIKSQTKTAFDDVNKTLHDSGNRYDDFTNRVKKNSGTLTGTLKEVGKAFLDNLGRGAAAGGLGAGVLAVKSQMQEAVRVGLDFGKSFAALASRADLSASKVKSLREEIKKLGASGADLGSLPAAVNELFGATGNIDQAMSVMGPVSKAAAMTSNKDAGQVAKFVADQLKGEGREINRGNVESLLQSSVAAMRGGQFANLDEAMGSMAGLHAMSIRDSKMSDKQVGALMAGATRTGVSKDVGMAGVNALLDASANPLLKSSVLNGILGASVVGRNGKLNVEALGSKSALAHMNALGKSDTERKEMFRAIAGDAGFGGDSADALFSFVKNFSSLNAGIKKVMGDTKTLEQAVEETTDNLSDNLGKLRNSMVTGFDDILKPVEDLGNKFAKGHIKEAFGALPGALLESGKGIAQHPLLVAGGLAATAGTGFLLKTLGLGGGGLVKGAAIGKALQKTGITPVYVVNMGDSAASSPWSAKDLASGGKGIAGGALALATGPVGIVAGAALGIGAAASKITWKNGQGESLNAMEHLADVIEKYFGDFSLEKAQPRRVQVDVQSNDPQFMARPKTTDLNREAH